LVWVEVGGCYTYCPTDFTENTTDYLCDRPNTNAVLHYVFGQIGPALIPDLIHGIVGRLGGSDNKYYPDPYTNADPIAMKDRGVWFNGTAATFSIPPTGGLTGNKIILNPLFTFISWSKLMSNTATP
jgi:hypothetical protein